MAHRKSFSRRPTRSRFLSLKRFVLTTQLPSVLTPPLSLNAFSKLDLILSRDLKEAAFVGGLIILGPIFAALLENERSTPPSAIPSIRAAEFVGLRFVSTKFGIVLDDNPALVPDGLLERVADVVALYICAPGEPDFDTFNDDDISLVLNGPFEEKPDPVTL